MAKVYVVLHQDYDGAQLYAAFTDDAHADHLAEVLGVGVQAIDLDPDVDKLDQKLFRWKVRVDRKGRVTKNERFYEYDPIEDSLVDEFKEDRWGLLCHLWAQDKDEAAQIAKEKAKSVFQTEPAA